MHGVSIVCVDAAEGVDAFHGDVWAGGREGERLSVIQDRDGDSADEGVAVQPRGSCFVLTMSQADGMSADGCRRRCAATADQWSTTVTSRRADGQGKEVPQRGERTHGHAPNAPLQATREASPVMGINENGLSH